MLNQLAVFHIRHPKQEANEFRYVMLRIYHISAERDQWDRVWPLRVSQTDGGGVIYSVTAHAFAV